MYSADKSRHCIYCSYIDLWLVFQSLLIIMSSLCMFYTNGVSCKWTDLCNYKHEIMMLISQTSHLLLTFMTSPCSRCYGMRGCTCCALHTASIRSVQLECNVVITLAQHTFQRMNMCKPEGVHACTVLSEIGCMCVMLHENAGHSNWCNRDRVHVAMDHLAMKGKLSAISCTSNGCCMI